MKHINFLSPEVKNGLFLMICINVLPDLTTFLCAKAGNNSTQEISVLGTEN